MRNLSIVKIIVVSLLIVVSLGAIFYVKAAPTVNEAGLNPWLLEGINPILLTDGEGNHVQQQLIHKVAGAKKYYGNGQPIYIYQDASGTKYSKAFLVDGFYTKSGKTAYIVYDGSLGFFDKVSDGNKADYVYFADSELTPVYEYDADNNPVYAYATNPSGLYLFDTDSPWEAAASSNESLISSDSIIGDYIDVAKPDGSGNMHVQVPSDLSATAWADLTEEQKALYLDGGANEDTYKELAVALYYNANKKYIEADYSGFYSNCLTSNVAAGMNNMIDLNILELRKQGVYYRQDFRVERNIPLVAMLGLDGLANLGLELTCGERRYFDPTMDHTEYYRTKTAIIDNEGLYFTDWNIGTGSKIADDVYRKQNLTATADSKEYTNAVIASDKYTLNAYEKCAHIIAIDTIKTAYVAFDTKTNQFKIYIDLDLSQGGDSKAVEKTIKGIRDGSGDQNAAYTSIVINTELWQNGYYKTWNQYEFWQGKVSSFAVESTFDYYDVFLYGEENVPLEEFVNRWDDANWTASKASYAAFTAE